LILQNRFTPLHFAACFGHKEISHLLLDHGAKQLPSEVYLPQKYFYEIYNSKIIPQKGTTPIECAIASKHTEIEQLLVKHQQKEIGIMILIQ